MSGGRWIVAVHEGSHCVAAAALGARVTRSAILEGGGVTEYEGGTRRARIIAALAGHEGERLLLHPSDVSAERSRDDFAKATRHAMALAATLGRVSEKLKARRAPPEPATPSVLHTLPPEKVLALIAERAGVLAGRRAARAARLMELLAANARGLLEANLVTVRIVAEKLAAFGELNEKQLRAALEEGLARQKTLGRRK